MAIAIESGPTRYTNNTNVTTVSGSFTLANGSTSGRLVEVRVALKDFSDPGSISITGVTFNAVSCTAQTPDNNDVNGDTQVNCRIFTIDNASLPASAGSYTVEATTGTTQINYIEIIEYSGIDAVVSHIEDSNFGTSTTLTPTTSGDYQSAIFVAATPSSTTSSITTGTEQDNTRYGTYGTAMQITSGYNTTGSIAVSYSAAPTATSGCCIAYSALGAGGVGTGASAGTSTVSGIGESIASSAGSSDGSSTASGVGKSVISAAGSSDGSSTVSGVGESVTGSVGSSLGSSTVTGIGASIADSAGSSSGTATAAGVGASLVDAEASSTGTSTVTGIGDSSLPGQAVGSSAGTSTVSGVGSSIVIGVGSSAGSSAVSGIGSSLSIISAIGSSTGNSNVIGISVSLESERKKGGGKGARRRHRQFANVDGKLIEVSSYKEAEKLINNFNSTGKVKKRRITLGNGPYVSLYDAGSMPVRDIKKSLGKYYSEEEILLIYLIAA